MPNAIQIQLSDALTAVLDQKIDAAVAKAVRRNENAQPKYYTLTDAAKAAHVAHGTLTSWIETEGLPVALIGGGVQRIKRTDLEAFMDAHTHSIHK